MTDILFAMLKTGYSVDYGVLSICALRGTKPRWQVHCESYKYPEAMLYPYTDEGLESAIKDFLNIKRGLDKDGIRNNQNRNK